MIVSIQGNEYKAIRVKSDKYGNPRYILHYSAFLSSAESTSAMSLDSKINLSLYRANKIGGKKYRGKNFGGGIVLQSYNLQSDMDKITF